MKKLIILLLLAFSAVVFADSYSTTAAFEDSIGPGFPGADVALSFDNDYTCSVEGIVLSGDPCNGPARVCVGANITLTPNLDTTWRNIDIGSAYPTCRPDTDMVDYSARGTNDIGWLDTSFYDSHSADWLDSRWRSEGIPLYHDLGTFHTEAVKYEYGISASPYYNKRGHANVFCKGTYQVRLGGTTISTRDMDDLRTIPIPLRSEGSVTIRSTLRDVECFASVVKHPVDDTGGSTDCFRMYFFAYNAPTIPNVIEDSRIEVVDIQPELTIRSVDVESYVGSTYLLRINVENTGDVRVRAMRVRPLCTSGCYVGITGWLDCMHYGFCVSDSGFGSYIAPGATQDLYVTYGGPLSGDIIEITYESPDEVCSDTAEWPLIVNIPDTNVTRCEIEPSSNIVTPYEVHEYTVTCFNSLGSVVPCSGNNWYWDSMPGGFVERTSSYAYAYTADSLSDVSGRIAYETGGVICTADVLSDNDGSGDDPFVFTCDLTPDSVSMDVGESQYFDLRCSEAYRGVTSFVFPTSVDYAMVSGLAGALSDETVRGVNFTATVDNVTGDVEAMSWYTHPDDGSLVGYIDWSDVTVGMGGGGNETDDGGDEGDEDEYEDCEIDPSDITRYPGWDGSVTVSCGSPPDFGSPCSDVIWAIDSEIGYIDDFTDDYAHYVVDEDATLGDSGEIWARVNAGTSDEGLCHADILIAEPECVEFS